MRFRSPFLGALPFGVSPGGLFDWRGQRQAWKAQRDLAKAQEKAMRKALKAQHRGFFSRIWGGFWGLFWLMFGLSFIFPGGSQYRGALWNLVRQIYVWGSEIIVAITAWFGGSTGAGTM